VTDYISVKICDRFLKIVTNFFPQILSYFWRNIMTEIYSVKIFDRICDWFWKILTECIDFTNFSFFLWHHKQSKGRGGVHLYVLPEPPTPAFFSISLCSLLPPKILTLAPACPSPALRKRGGGCSPARQARAHEAPTLLSSPSPSAHTRNTNPCPTLPEPSATKQREGGDHSAAPQPRAHQQRSKGGEELGGLC